MGEENIEKRNQDKINEIIDEDDDSDIEDEWNFEEEYLICSDQNEKDEIDNFKEVLERLKSYNEMMFNQLIINIGTECSNRLSQLFNRHRIWKEKTQSLLQSIIVPIQNSLSTNVNAINSDI